MTCTEQDLLKEMPKTISEMLEFMGMTQLSYTQLRKSYRKLCKKYHPDNLETGDVKNFIKTSYIYSILSKKVIYKTYRFDISLSDILNQKTLWFMGETIPLKLQLTTKLLFSNKKFIVLNHEGKRIKIKFKICPKRLEHIQRGSQPQITKTVHISLQDIQKGYIMDRFGDKELSVKIPLQGSLITTGSFLVEGKPIKVKYKFIIDREVI